MNHYIITGGQFDMACDKLLSTDYMISWLDRISEIDPKGLTENLDNLGLLGVQIDLAEGEDTLFILPDFIDITCLTRVGRFSAIKN